LPSEFTGPYLLLRFRFYYNPDASDLAAYKPAPAVADSVVHASVLQDVADSNPPKYPKKAVKNKLEGVVRMDAYIDPDGKVKSLYTSEGNLILADAASHAIRKWRFHPAVMNGKPVQDRVRIKVEFRLEGEQVRAQVVSPEANRAAQPGP
jgi:protein TonB